MKASRWWSHGLLRGTVTSVAAVALIAVGVSAAATSTRTLRAAGPGYPPPGGIYAGFTDCPLKNPLLQEIPSVPQALPDGLSVAACVDGAVQSGSVKIGNITTPVTNPVDVQFSFDSLPNSTLGGDNSGGVDGYASGIFGPPEGVSKIILTTPDRIPGSLSKELGCPSTDPTVESVCKQIPLTPGGNVVSALASEAGNITNFGVLTWTQRIKFQLINPLLGNNCYIGSDSNPIVINPSLSLAPGGRLEQLVDPNPAKHPGTFVLEITKASASDTTFTAPGVTGCGPGGASNIPVDLALDTGTGLPSASGSNALVLTGKFGIAATVAGENQTINSANTLLSAFEDSSRAGGAARIRARRPTVHVFATRNLRRVVRRLGLS